MKTNLRRRRPAPPVHIVDLPARHERSYLVCLEDWSSEMAEAGDAKASWYEKMRHEGLRVKVALDDSDRAIGMIQYLPIEHSPADGDDLYMILCIWVHGYDEGVGDHQNRGIGRALLAAAESDARSFGAAGMAAWGLSLPVWMKASWYRRHGYRRADRSGVRELLWKPFTSAARPPRWVSAHPVPEPDDAHVDVLAYQSGWCPAANLVVERARRAADELGDDVRFTQIDTSDRETLLACGHSDEVFVDGRPLQRGAPPSSAKVRRTIERRLHQRQRARR